MKKEIDDKLEHWDLFYKKIEDGIFTDIDSLWTGKRWPKCMQGLIAQKIFGSWEVRSIEGLQLGYPEENSRFLRVQCSDRWISVEEDNLCTYMEILSGTVHQLMLAEHEMELNFSKAQKYYKR